MAPPKVSNKGVRALLNSPLSTYNIIIQGFCITLLVSALIYFIRKNPMNKSGAVYQPINNDGRNELKLIPDIFLNKENDISQIKENINAQHKLGENLTECIYIYILVITYYNYYYYY